MLSIPPVSVSTSISKVISRRKTLKPIYHAVWNTTTLIPGIDQYQLNNRNIKSLKVTFPEVRSIVAENDKQRFSLIHKSASPSTKPDPTLDHSTTSHLADLTQEDASSTNPADFLIRANQGHSLAVEADHLLTPVTEENIPAMVVHGTTHSAWLQIVESGGLKKMGRTHVHFASGLPAGFRSMVETTQSQNEEDASGGTEKVPPPVISGMRNSSSVLVFVDIKKAIDGGLKFWLSENGVILSEGDGEGLIDLRYFSQAEDRTGGVGVLVRDGVVVNQAPESWASKGGGRRGGRQGKQGKTEPGAGLKVEQAQALKTSP